MTEHAAPTQDDAVEPGLAEDLLGPADDAGAGPTAARDSAESAAGWSDLRDDEDYLAPAARRGKLTTGLLVALIFLAGLLVGTLLTRVLAPAPAPQVVYGLSDSGASAPTAAPSATR